LSTYKRHVAERCGERHRLLPVPRDGRAEAPRRRARATSPPLVNRVAAATIGPNC